MKTKKIIATLLSFSLVLGVCSCKKKTEETETSPSTSEETTTTTTTEATTTTEETTTIDRQAGLYDPNNPLAVNPLTGIQDMDPENIGNRSVGIVINNVPAALPQRGVSVADLLYEYETENGITRMLICFADVNDVPNVGSIRSARVLSNDLCAGTNSIFVHFGRNARVPDHQAAWGIRDIDGNANASAHFWRDQTWLNTRSGIEHTAVTDGEHILNAIEALGIDRTGETPMAFNFVPDDSVDLAYGEPCSEINVYFSANNSDALFTYDPETGKYLKSEYGHAQIDETTGDQIAVDNIIVIYAEIRLNCDGYTIDAYLEDGGNGYYICDGRLVNITWDKDRPLDLITLYNEAGDELEVNRGVTYVCVVDNDQYGRSTWTGDGISTVLDE